MRIGIGRARRACSNSSEVIVTMRAVARATLHVGAGALALACASAPPKPPAPPEPRPAALTTPTPPDLSEVPAPMRLAAIVRWRNPQATLETIYQWTGIHLSAADLAGEAYDRGLAETLAYDAPVDAVVAIDAQQQGERDVAPQVAVAFGVRSIEAARRAAQAIGTVTEGAVGELRVRLKATKRRGEKAFCVLTPAAGAAPARFICGQRERDVDALAPYLARTLPRRDLGAEDLHVELHVPPVLDAYGPAYNQALRLGAAYLPRKAQIGEPVFDRALERAAGAIAEEFGTAAKDLDEIAFDVALAPDQATVDAKLKMRGQASWTSGTLASQASRAGEPPPLFWRLPKTSTSASYWYPPEQARFDEIRHTLGELLDGFLLHEGLAPADRAPLVAVFSDRLAIATPWVTASGAFIDGSKVGSATPSAPSSDAAADDTWSITGFAGATPVADTLKSLVVGLNRAKVQALLKSAAARAGGSDADAKVPAKTALPITVRSVAPPKGLPTGSLDFEVTLSRELVARSVGATAPVATGGSAGAGKGKSPNDAAAPSRVHLLVISRPTETWMGWASQRDKLAATMLGVLDTAKNAETLATRADLEPMRRGPFVGASFSTLDGLLRSLRSPLARVMGGDRAKSLDEARALLDSSPHRGQTPMRITTAISTDGPPLVHTHLDVPKGVIEDLIIVAASSLMQGLARP